MYNEFKFLKYHISYFPSGINSLVNKIARVKLINIEKRYLNLDR